MTNLSCKKPKPCEPTETPKEIYPDPTPAFDICVGDYTLSWDGARATVVRNRTTPDGTYSTITLQNGCVVEYGYSDEPTYTPPYCNPNPSSCQDGVTGGVSTASVSQNKDNSLIQTTAGLFARTFIEGDGLEVTGTGTQNNPYKIKLGAVTTSGTIVGKGGITVDTSPNNVSYVSLAPTGVTKGIYNGFTINEYGQIVGISEAIQNNSSGIIAGEAIVVTEGVNGTTVGHDTFDLPDTAMFGGFFVTLDSSGHITSAERLANVTAGTYSLGAYNVSIDEYGSIHAVSQSDAVVSGAGTFTTTDNKVVSYDGTGRITSVIDYGTSGGQAMPLAIRDMYKFTVTMDSIVRAVQKEVYGNDITLTNGTYLSFDVVLPSYITSEAQVTVHNALDYTVNLQTRLLTIVHTKGTTATNNDNQYRTITLVLRG